MENIVINRIVNKMVEIEEEGNGIRKREIQKKVEEYQMNIIDGMINEIEYWRKGWDNRNPGMYEDIVQFLKEVKRRKLNE